MGREAYVVGLVTRKGFAEVVACFPDDELHFAGFKA